MTCEDHGGGWSKQVSRHLLYFLMEHIDKGKRRLRVRKDLFSDSSIQHILVQTLLDRNDVNDEGDTSPMIIWNTTPSNFSRHLGHALITRIDQTPLPTVDNSSVCREGEIQQLMKDGASLADNFFMAIKFPHEGSKEIQLNDVILLKLDELGKLQNGSVTSNFWDQDLGSGFNPVHFWKDVKTFKSAHTAKKKKMKHISASEASLINSFVDRFSFTPISEDDDEAFQDILDGGDRIEVTKSLFQGFSPLKVKLLLQWRKEYLLRRNAFYSQPNVQVGGHQKLVHEWFLQYSISL
jgi:hypothetical protein